MGIYKTPWLGGALLAIGLLSGCISRSPQPPRATVVLPPVVSSPQPVAPSPPVSVTVPPVIPALGTPPVPVDLPPPVAPSALDTFMADRPAAAAVLRQHPALAQWFRTEWNQPGAFPIHWDDQPPHTSPVAENTSSSQDRSTTIRVSRNLSPVDQLMALFYETCNAGGRSRVIALGALAAQGRISRQDFIEGIDMEEFTANRRLKETFPELLPLSHAELARDPLYQHVFDIPDTYAEYKSRNVRIHNMNYLNAQELYGREYDELIKRARPGATPAGP